MDGSAVGEERFKLERETGFEPATSSLGSWHSTTELLPLESDGSILAFSFVRSSGDLPRLRNPGPPDSQLFVTPTVHSGEIRHKPRRRHDFTRPTLAHDP